MKYIIVVIDKDGKYVNAESNVNHQDVYGFCKGVETSGNKYHLEPQVGDFWDVLGRILEIVIAF
jgi:hypothetical protein